MPCEGHCSRRVEDCLLKRLCFFGAAFSCWFCLTEVVVSMDNTLDDESVADISCDSTDDISDPPAKKKKTYLSPHHQATLEPHLRSLLSTLDTSHMLRTGKEQRVRKITLILS